MTTMMITSDYSLQVIIIRDWRTNLGLTNQAR